MSRKLKYIVSVLFVLVSIKLNGQAGNKIDSLKNIIQQQAIEIENLLNDNLDSTSISKFECDHCYESVAISGLFVTTVDEYSNVYTGGRTNENKYVHPKYITIVPKHREARVNVLEDEFLSFIVFDKPEVIDTLYLVSDTISCKEIKKQKIVRSVIAEEGFMQSWILYLRHTYGVQPNIQKEIARHLKILGYLDEYYIDFDNRQKIINALNEFQSHYRHSNIKIDYKTLMKLEEASKNKVNSSLKQCK